MGTTVTAALVNDGRIAFGHVGDSRAYLLRDGALQQLSDDHSLVGELVRRGALTPDEAARHPQRSIITRALGADDEVDVDTWSIDAQEGDVVLLCSDGLSGMVGEDEMQRIMQSGAGLQQVARELVVAANAAGRRRQRHRHRLPHRRRRHGGARAHRAGRDPAHPVRAARAAAAAQGDALPARLPARAAGVPAAWPPRCSASPGCAGRTSSAPPTAGASRSTRACRSTSGPACACTGRSTPARVLVATLSQEEREALFDHELVSLGEAQRRVGRIAATRPWDASTRADTGPAAS